MRASGLVTAGLAALAASAALAQVAEPPSQSRPLLIPPPPAATAAAAAPARPGAVKPVVLTRAVLKMDAGAPYAVISSDKDCKTTKTLVWNGGATDQKIGPYQDPFRDALKAAGYKIEGDSSNLFEGASGDTAAAEFAIGALITKIRVEACAVSPGAGKAVQVKGHEDMAVEWQVFSRLSREVVAKVETSATFTLDTPTEGGPAQLNVGAFGANAAKLAASTELRRAVGGTAPASGQVVRPAVQSAIPLTGAATAVPRPVNQEVAEVAVVFAGDGEGSGFLVSRDGYVLTDAHVVGAADQVRLRWPDGREELGRVVRIARERDVALIKTDAQGREPLALRRAGVAVGETVFAIGAPLGQRYQGTVTRGVVSARRVFDGYDFVQSDITVNPGGSGGPLLDEQGRVVGLTRSGVRIGSAPTGINLFIPAASALDFLALEPR